MSLMPVDHSLLDRLRLILPAQLVQEPGAKYLEEPRGSWKGQAGVVVLPETTDQVSAIVKLANEHSVGIVPFGGGTGMVGG